MSVSHNSSMSAASIMKTRSANNIHMDDVYDDACDLGQFFLNPCWFLFVKAQRQVQRKAPPSSAATTTTTTTTTSRVTATSSATSHTVQQLTYVVGIYGGWAFLFLRVYPLVPLSQSIANYHQYNGYILFVLCLTSWRYAKATSPGIITAETIWKFDNYQHDNVLYKKDDDDEVLTYGGPTTTASLGTTRKLARSKFDRYSQTHVPRFDHFCGWLGNAIGEENYRYFIVFVVIHTVMLLYGGIMVWQLLLELGTNQLLLAQKQRMAKVELGFSVVDKIWAAAKVEPSIVLLCLLMGLASIGLVSFLSFHIMLIYKGMTTNEFFKWRAIHQLLQVNDKEQVGTSHGDGIDEEAEKTNCGDDEPKSRQLLSSSANKHYYNLGLYGNLHEIFFPRSLRKGCSTTSRHSKKL